VSEVREGVRGESGHADARQTLRRGERVAAIWVTNTARFEFPAVHVVETVSIFRFICRQTCPGAAGPARDKREGERADGDADFEVVAGEETEARERDAPRREAKAEAPKKKKKVSESSAKQRRGGDEPLVPKRAKFASGSSEEKRGGRSYEETATAARRKGSGAARAKPSHGFSKPSRG
jgi:hypothetical protein